MDHLPLIGAAIAVLLVGIFLYLKIAKAIMKLVILAVVVVVLAVLFWDKLPF